MYVSTILSGICCGLCCAGLQYRMASRLEQKRWLLLLQPILHGAAALCFGLWVLSLDKLRDSPSRFIPLTFVILLICTVIGWVAGNLRRRRSREE